MVSGSPEANYTFLKSTFTYYGMFIDLQMSGMEQHRVETHLKKIYTNFVLDMSSLKSKHCGDIHQKTAWSIT